MTAWYEFEELVGHLWHRWAAGATSYPHHGEHAVEFEPLRDTLAVYFRALGGIPGVTLTTAQAAGKEHRLSWRQRLGFSQEAMETARLDGENLVLPASIGLFDSPDLNRDAYFWLTAYMAATRPLPKTTDPLQRDLGRLAEAVRVESHLNALFPGLVRRYRRLCARLVAIRPRRRLPSTEASLEQVILELLGADLRLDPMATEMRKVVIGRHPVTRFRAPNEYRSFLPVPLWGEISALPRTQARAEAGDAEPGGDGEEALTGKRRAERRRLDQTERDDPLMLNPFEKMLSWSEMININRPVEDDEKENARKAADQLDELTLSRHQRKAATRLKMELDIAPETAAESPLEAPVTWPEWHFRKRRYLDDYCAVYTPPAEQADPDWQPDEATRRQIKRIRRQFEALRSQREKLRAQYDGEEFDLDAVVRAQTEQAAGHSGSDRIYCSWREQVRDLAVATLVDVSLSTDAWIDERHVIDIEKQALLVLAHGIAACGDDQAIFTFTSKRRQQVTVTPVKSFDEPMGRPIERRIAALKPGLYTRMGAAIRHVAEELSHRPNRHRLLLILTDGKPNDTDHYEGRYAIEDTRMAVREARRKGMAVFAVTIDSHARQYLPLIFGRSGYALVPRAASLSATLPAIYRQLSSR